MRFLMLCRLAVTAFVFMGNNLVFAQDSASQKTGGLPDLVVKSVSFKPQPKQGTPIGSLRISIENKGTADAGPGMLKISCEVAGCDKNNDCQDVKDDINATIAVPPLKKGVAADLFWTPDSPSKWVAGNYLVSVEVDVEKKINEIDESNNVMPVMTYIGSFSPSTKPPEAPAKVVSPEEVQKIPPGGMLE